MAADDRIASVQESWALAPEALLQALKVAPDMGLDTAEARRRRRHHGLNRLRPRPPKFCWISTKA